MKEKKSAKWYKILGVCVIVLLTGFILFWRFHGIVVSVDKSLPAVECMNTDGKMQEREIEVCVSGKYYYKLWAADLFSGKISIENYEQTEGNVRDLRMEENAPLIYRQYDHAVLNTSYLGIISVGKGFSSIKIWVDDGDGIDTENPEHIIYTE